MGLFELLFGKKKQKTNTKQITKTRPTIEQKYGYIKTVKCDVSSQNYDELLNCFIALDLETTGLSVDVDEIIEVGVVRFEQGCLTDSYGSLVYTGRPVPLEAYRVNHISTELLKKEGRSPEIVYKELVDFLGDALNGKIYICAHNAKFDISFLAKTLEQFGYNGEIRFIDTLALARKLIQGLPNYRQSTVAALFDLHNVEEHRAVADAIVCGNVFMNLLSLQKDSIQEEIIRNEKKKPNDVESEVFAIIVNSMKNSGCDIRNIKAYRDSSSYVLLIDEFILFRYKISRNKQYLVIPEKYVKGINDKIEPCTKTEGNEYVRLLFDDPFELDQYGGLLTKIYNDTKKSKGINMDEYQSQYFSQTNITGFTEFELKELLEKARARQDAKIVAIERERKELEDQEARKEQKRLERIEKSQKKEMEVLERKNRLAALVEQAEDYTKEDIVQLTQLSALEGKRAILQLDDDNSIIKVYQSVSDASRSAGVAPKTIRDAASGKYKHAGGFCWKYVDEIYGEDTL